MAMFLQQPQQQQYQRFLFEDFKQDDFDFECRIPRQSRFQELTVFSTKKTKRPQKLTLATVSNHSSKSKIAIQNQRRSAKVTKRATNIVKTINAKAKTKTQMLNSLRDINVPRHVAIKIIKQTKQRSAT